MKDNSPKNKLRNIAQKSWAIFCKRIWFYLLVTLAIVLITFVQTISKSAKDAIIPSWINLILIFLIILSLTTYIGFGKIALAGVRGEKISFLSLFTGWRYWWRVFFLYIILTFFALTGFISNYLPAIFNFTPSQVISFIFFVLFTSLGLYVIFRLQFAPFLIIDKNLNLGQSLKKSFSLSGHRQTLLLQLALFSIIFNFFGNAFYGVGLLITIPLTLIVYGCVYDDILHAKVNK
jgi:hypothetical protein